MPNTSSEIIELQIDSLSFNGGRGVGRLNGIVVFVPSTAPGDLIKAKVTARKARFWEAELLEVLQPSAHRRQPPCKFAQSCGGCTWQHVTYSEQLAQKQKILEASLKRLKKTAEFDLLSLIPAPHEFYYRNRIQLHVQRGEVGFFSRRSRDIVAIDECMIAEKSLNQKLNEIDRSRPGRVEVAVLANGETVSRFVDSDLEAAVFGQVNSAQNEVLKAAVDSLITQKPEWIFDLYSGSGNFTFSLQKRFPDVAIIAVEMNHQSVSIAKAMSEANSLIQWKAQDVASALSTLPPRHGSGLVLLDPPRGGVTPDIIKQLVRHDPQQIIYVSCDPTTFARDAELLLHSGKWRLRSVQGLDMFPQTEHVELVASLCAAT